MDMSGLSLQVLRLKLGRLTTAHKPVSLSGWLGFRKEFAGLISKSSRKAICKLNSGSDKNYLLASLYRLKSRCSGFARKEVFRAACIFDKGKRSTPPSIASAPLDAALLAPTRLFGVVQLSSGGKKTNAENKIGFKAVQDFVLPRYLEKYKNES